MRELRIHGRGGQGSVIASKLLADATERVVRAPIDRQLHDAGTDLLLQAPDALHKEFVEVGRDDRQELEP